MMQPAERRQAMQLMWDLVDKKLDAESAEKLAELLRAEPSARKLYAEYLSVASALRARYALGTQDSNLPGVNSEDDPLGHAGCPSLFPQLESATPPVSKPSSVTRIAIPRLAGRTSSLRKLSLASAILAVALVFYGTFALLSMGLRPDRLWKRASEPAVAVKPLPPAAFLTADDRAVWGDQTKDGGKSLRPGQKLELARGLAEITFASGAKVDLQGPATLTIEDRDMAALEVGKLTAHVPEEAIGFAVQTPSMLVVDLGTDFGVEVAGLGDDQVHVFKGQVELKFRSPGSDVETQEPVRLHAGQALTIDKSGKKIESLASDSGRFYSAAEPEARIDLPVGEAYVTAVKLSRPVVYWRFEEVINNRFVRNEMSYDWPANLYGAVRIGGPWGYRRAIFTANDVVQYIDVDSPITGLRDECTIELFVRPDEYHEGELVSLVHPATATPPESTFVSLGAVELLATENTLFPGRRLRFLHRNPPGAFDGDNVVSRAPYQVGAWQHVVATRSATKVSLYINGILVGSETTRQDPVTIDPQIVVGRLYREGEADQVRLEARQLHGQIDELSIYGRELTADEVRRHYVASGISVAGSEQ